MPDPAASPTPIRIGICVPTIRELEIERFLAAWSGPWAEAARDRYDLRVFVHEDGARASFALDAGPLEVVHTSHADVDAKLGGDAWIVSRGSAACRCFPLLLAWEAGCEYVVTLDDDCLPAEGDGASFLDEHLGAFRLSRWFHTIDGPAPRGTPYGDLGALPVVLNHGLWTGVPDLDGASSLRRDGTEVRLRARREVIAPGLWFPMSAMNVCLHRSIVPAAYSPLMGVADHGFDRFDDIWSGLFVKRIADHLGLYVTNGVPFLRHDRASDPFVNLRKEALGIHLHEFFWRHVAAAPLDGARTVAEAYTALAAWVGRFPRACPEAPSVGDYFERLATAMARWPEVLARFAPREDGPPARKAIPSDRSRRASRS